MQGLISYTYSIGLLKCLPISFNLLIALFRATYRAKCSLSEAFSGDYEHVRVQNTVKLKLIFVIIVIIFMIIIIIIVAAIIIMIGRFFVCKHFLKKILKVRGEHADSTHSGGEIQTPGPGEEGNH